MLPIRGRVGAGSGGDTWVWDGNIEKPTLQPSILRSSCGWHGYMVNGKLRTEALDSIEQVAFNYAIQRPQPPLFDVSDLQSKVVNEVATFTEEAWHALPTINKESK